MKSRNIIATLLAVICLMPFTARGAQDVKADVPPINPTIKGKMNIDFKSRTQLDDKGSITPGVQDVYKMDMTIGDTLLFGGQIKFQPPIFSSMLGREKQSAKLDYLIDLSIKNPKDLSQPARRIGRLVGGVPIDKRGVYHYDQGTLRLATDAIGNVSEHSGNFTGSSAGKPFNNDSALAKLKKQAITITKQVNGHTAQIVVTKYDEMDLSMLMPSGPVPAYSETQVSGKMLYDYEREAWYFRGVTMTYTKDGQTHTDKLTGNIKWVPKTDYSTSGEGEYEFDVRVNEPDATVTESQAFAPEANEATFFEADANLKALTGTWKYKDTLIGSGEDQQASASDVTIDMVGNGLTKAQVVNLAKLIVFVDIVPMNAD